MSVDSMVRWKPCSAMPTLWDFEARQCDTIFVIFLLRYLKPRLPKFQRLSVVCLVTGDTRNDFFPVSRKRLFTVVGFVAVDWPFYFALP